MFLCILRVSSIEVEAPVQGRLCTHEPAKGRCQIGVHLQERRGWSSAACRERLRGPRPQRRRRCLGAHGSAHRTPPPLPLNSVRSLGFPREGQLQPSHPHSEPPVTRAGAARFQIGLRPPQQGFPWRRKLMRVGVGRGRGGRGFSTTPEIRALPVQGQFSFCKDFLLLTG